MYILEILEFLFIYSDINKHVTVREISEYLEKKGIKPQKKTIRANLMKIMEFFSESRDFVVMSEEMADGHFEYWVAERIIDVYDGVNIANAVCMNDSLEIKYKKSVVDKICMLIGKVNEKQFYKIINMKYFNMTDFRHISYVSEILTDAVNEDKKVSFEYNSDPKNNKTKKVRVVSPYKIIQKNRFSYLLADCDSHETPISFFRLDRISNPEILDEKANSIDINIEEYVNFPLISLGKTITVRMTVNKEIMGYIYDRYGYDVSQYNADENRVKIVVDDKLCDNLLGWLFMLGNNVEIESPEVLKTQYKNKLDKMIKLYK